MSDFLKEMARSSAARAEAARRSYRDDELDRASCPLARTAFDVIAEIKNRSPAEGDLSARAGDRAERARIYAEGGAVAISVLTEPDRFAGDLAHLAEVVDAVAGVPVMRKDFIVDPVQVLEAKAAGASGVLLIAAMLPDRELRRLLDCAFAHDLFVLLEAFDEDDLARITTLFDKTDYADRAAGDKLLVGVNTRNLRTLAVDAGRLAALAALLPGGVTSVAESGLHTPADAREAASLGYRMALVGTALMRAADPAALVAAMLTAGRSATACS
jgi:indole-3-glycerol phosphate synthase